MKKLTITLLAVALGVMGMMGQRQVKMPTEHMQTPVNDYTELNSGFFCAVEGGGAYLFDKAQNPGLADFNAVAGYRLNEYLRAGIGLGVRYFWDCEKVRQAYSHFAMPLFLDVRGNFIPTNERDVVPYWSVDLGGSFPDGFMFRPTLGLRIGQERNAFLVGISYLGQQVRQCKLDGQTCSKDRKFLSGVQVRIGYEF